MIAVINPSGSAGHSFKGLHQYLSHDVDANTSERVGWTETRGMGTDDPEVAWRVMVATAKMQNNLKREQGIKPGPPPKDGPVMHVVLTFDNDEPSDRETMREAADEFLSQLGVDPAKMRAEKKPKRRQFADEHQSVMYMHKDTDHTHLHLMINRVHPQTGLLLPSNNDQIKAQKWALDFSKRHGTEHKTPAREQNYEARKNGEYVKGPRRKSRNTYELEKRLAQRANDNDKVAAFREAERKKNGALAKRGRDLKTRHDAQWDKLVADDKRKAVELKAELAAKIAQAKIANRCEFRPAWEKVRNDQAGERTKFEKLEKSVLGRGANMVKAYTMAGINPQAEKSSPLVRALRVVSSAEGRKDYFDRAQKYEQSELKRDQAGALADTVSKLKSDNRDKLAAKDEAYKEKSAKLIEAQKAEVADLKQSWKERQEDRSKSLKELEHVQQPIREKAQNTQSPREDHMDALLLRVQMREDQRETQREKAREQDNSRDYDD